jgi:PQQ-dependent catabolism-associated CXXCW motif protein
MTGDVSSGASLRRSVMVLAAFAWTSLATAADAPPEPDHYRTEDYRAPTPESLAGARVVGTAEAEALWRAHVIFLDVMPRPPRPANLPAGTLWRDPPRRNIPGSVWLPNTGYGELAAVTQSYLRHGVERATRGERDTTVVVYCQKDCWMSWNAARRLVSWGYTHIIWYPDGTDGWQAAGLPLEDATPISEE